MIGVSVSQTDLEIAEELFELFKTPWEPVVPARKYRIVLCTGECLADIDAELFLVYGSGEVAANCECKIATEQVDGPVEVEWRGSTFPIYGNVALFTSAYSRCLAHRGRSVECVYRCGSRLVRRIGYDLFHEIRYLLTHGQPPSQALIPTLERHIELLRQLLRESNIPFAEILPRPDGYDFICCLTHDVDFFGIRRHKFDRTLLGFLYRASLGTVVGLLRGRRSAVDVARNWMALLFLPLVFARLTRDFWTPFEDYARVEQERPSTFFLVPFRGRPGVAPDGSIATMRAVPYQVSEIEGDARIALTRGTELAVHGIDAWHDADIGRAELRELTDATGQNSAGVRMHWLYFTADSPRHLEAAGFDYDSTWGYNDAVGYRAGTSQVFRLPGSERLMELPLSIMDSALFYSGRMCLAREAALQLCRQIIADSRRFGGVLVVNWHDRSLAPERLWDRCYRELIKEIGEAERTWFVTAGGAVNWFRWRRAIRFTAQPDAGGIGVAVSAAPGAMPAAVIRIHRPTGMTDIRFDGRESVTLDL
jgi:hypothetical protein